MQARRTRPRHPGGVLRGGLLRYRRSATLANSVQPGRRSPRVNFACGRTSRLGVGRYSCSSGGCDGPPTRALASPSIVAPFRGSDQSASSGYFPSAISSSPSPSGLGFMVHRLGSLSTHLSYIFRCITVSIPLLSTILNKIMAFQSETSSS